MQNKTFRLFISSTFSDFNQERRLLQTYVFPEIKKYCRELGKGYTFQPIDLRWGVSNEAQLDQKALELCIEEVQSSKSQPHPNFLIMAGNRYGWVPLPYAIEQTEFESIRENVEDTTLLDTWYKLDNNQLPASYIIQKRSGEYEAYDAWVKVENSLREILQEAVDKTPLTDVQKEKYFTSATEAEVIEGIFGYKNITSFQEALTHKDSNYPLLDSEHLYGYIRDVKSVEDESFHGMFIDEDVTQTNQFKDELRGAIKKENLLEVEANLTKLSKDEKNGSLNYSYDAIENEEDSQFITIMIAFIKRSIDSYEVEEASSPQELEAYEQERFKEDKLKLFIGREEPLKVIQAYIESDNDQPLVIYGPSGMGKSALMAKAIEETTKKKVYRFVGSTATLSSSEQLVISILKALGIEEQIRQIEDQMGQEKPEPIEEFYLRVHDHLKDIPDEKVIFIDAVDQLTNEDEFIWLPSKLPSNLKIIISALEDDTYPEDTKYFTALKKRTSNLYKLEMFEESETLIKSILKQYDRSITDTQLTYLQSIYKDINTPLYLTIAAQEMRHWSSEDKTIDIDPNGQELAPTQKGIIAEYIKNLTKLYHHDEELVKRVLSYIYLTEGLSEAELLELLSTDEAFVKKMTPDTYHNNVIKELPSVIWARLHAQLKAFIKLEEKNGQETMSFFHREFNDAISYQEDMQGTHEELITLVFKLIETYQYKSFESNRWGRLYINIVIDYHIRHEFNYIPDNSSKLKTHSDFINTLENANYQERLLKTLNKDGINLEKITKTELANSYKKFFYYSLVLLYNQSPNRWEEDYIKSLSNLALSLSIIGETEKAIELGQEALLLSKKNPDKWPDLYTDNLNALANHSKYTLNTDERIALYEEASEKLIKLYKEEPLKWGEKLIRILNNLATMYSKEKPNHAVFLYKYAFEISEENSNRWIEPYVFTLINISMSLKNIDEALKYLKKSLMTSKKEYNENKDRWAEVYIYSLNGLAYSLNSNGKSNESIELLEESLLISKEYFEENPYKWEGVYTKTLNDLVIVLANIGKINKAIEFLEEALVIKKEHFLNNKSRFMLGYTQCLNKLGTYLCQIGKINEVILLHKEALSITNKNDETFLDILRESLDDLANFLKSNDKKEKAVKLKLEVLEILKVLYKQNPDQWAVNYIENLGDLIISLNSIGESIEAFELEQESNQIIKILYEQNSDKWTEAYIKSLNDLSFASYAMGEDEEAYKLECKALEVKRQIETSEYIDNDEIPF